MLQTAPAPEEDVDDGGPDRPRRWSIAQLVVLALPTLLLFERAWDRRWMHDDGFINLRIVSNLLHGHGPVFNPGERVEAATSTLWIGILAVGEVLLPLRAEWVAVLGGIGLTVVGLGLATWGSAGLQRRVDPLRPILPLGALVLAVIPPVWDFASSGLEGGLTFAWVGATVWALGRWTVRPDRSFGMWPAALVGLGPLVRPDLAIATLLVLAAVVVADWSTTGWWARVRLLAAAFAVPFAYQVFRMGYFAAMVPNTALAKQATGSRWEVGRIYLHDFTDDYYLSVPAAVLAVMLVGPVRNRIAARDLRWLAATLVLPIAGVLQGLYVVRIGGDYMHARMLLPALWCIVAPLACTGLPRLTTDRRPRPVALAVVAVGLVGVVWAAVCGASLRRVNENPFIFITDARTTVARSFNTEHPVISDQQGWGPGSRGVTLDPAVAGYYHSVPLDVTTPPGRPARVYLAYGIGLPGFELPDDIYILDGLGLANPLVSRFVVETPSLPGHEKPIPLPWILALITTTPLPADQLEALGHIGIVAPLHVSAAGELDAETDAARRALECRPLVELREAVTEPLTPGRFLDNLFSAPRLSRLSIPADPDDAVDQLCD